MVIVLIISMSCVSLPWTWVTMRGMLVAGGSLWFPCVAVSSRFGLSVTGIIIFVP